MRLITSFYIIFMFNFVFREIVSAIFFNNNLEITLPQGKVRGSHSYIKNYRYFLGIPYAFVKHRFEEPGEPPSWNGTFNANHGTIKCMQYFEPLGLPVGQEDCLVLNVFTPLNPTNQYPVIVFLHGGGFYWGSNSHLIYDPRFLVKKNVIVVTVNYRLGAFGFLCLNHKEVPGNVGLKDQIAALKWIQKNIGYFGGDPNSVTLFGQSAGAAAVNYLLLSPSAERLFHRVIMDSGAVLMPQVFNANPFESVVKVAARLGFNSTDPDTLLEIFRNAPAQEIVKASYFNPANEAFSPYLFRPCIEESVTNQNIPLIAEHPRDLLKKTDTNIPMIIGFNDKEGIIYAANYDSKGLDNLNKDLTSILPDYLHFNNDADKEMFIASVKRFYFGNSTVTISGLIDYFSDSLFMYPIVTTAELLLERSNRRIYHYYFRYDSIRNLLKLTSRLPTTPGANHADELFYLFDPVVYQFLPNIPKDVVIIELLTNLWTSFAKNGYPTGAEISWEQDEEQLKFLEIGADVKMINLPNKERIEFWKEAYNRYGIKGS